MRELPAAAGVQIVREALQVEEEAAAAANDTPLSAGTRAAHAAQCHAFSPSRRSIV